MDIQATVTLTTEDVKQACLQYLLNQGLMVPCIDTATVELTTAAVYVKLSTPCLPSEQSEKSKTSLSELSVKNTTECSSQSVLTPSGHETLTECTKTVTTTSESKGQCYEPTSKTEKENSTSEDVSLKQTDEASPVEVSQELPVEAKETTQMSQSDQAQKKCEEKKLCKEKSKQNAEEEKRTEQPSEILSTSDPDAPPFVPDAAQTAEEKMEVLSKSPLFMST